VSASRESTHAAHRGEEGVLGLLKGNVQFDAQADFQVNVNLNKHGRRTRQSVTTRDAINPGGYSGDLLFRSNFQEERPNVSTGDLPQVQQCDVVWLRPACQPSDGRRAEVQALPVPPKVSFVERIFGGRKSSV